MSKDRSSRNSLGSFSNIVDEIHRHDLNFSDTHADIQSLPNEFHEYEENFRLIKYFFILTSVQNYSSARDVSAGTAWRAAPQPGTAAGKGDMAEEIQAKIRIKHVTPGLEYSFPGPCLWQSHKSPLSFIKP